MTIPNSRITIASTLLSNAQTAAVACRDAEIPYAVGCALLEQESNGRNIYGHDEGGALSGYPGQVNEENFRVFYWMVFSKGVKSNGVGPCQITYKGYFQQMAVAGLDPWKPYDNMLFGFRLLKAYYTQFGSWEKAGAAYNGGVTFPDAEYGKEFKAKLNVWRARFKGVE